MTYTIRTARKDRWTIGGIIKKGEKYLDKGFGQIEKINQKEKINPKEEEATDILAKAIIEMAEEKYKKKHGLC